MISFPSSTSFFGPNVVVNPKSASFRSVRPAKISASASASASCASTVERPGSHIASSTSSLYDVLGIRMEATCQEIKTAYRRLARVVHPDVVAAGKGKASADEFLKIHDAYTTLSDPDKRVDYDRRLFERQWQANNSSFAMWSSSYGSGYSSYNRPRKWETDQCW